MKSFTISISTSKSEYVCHTNVCTNGSMCKALNSRSEGLGFDSQCWPCAEVSGKLRIPHCLSLPSRNGYLVHRSKVRSIVAGCIGTHLAKGKVKSVEHALSWSLDSKQLPLPLPLCALPFVVGTVHVFVPFLLLHYNSVQSVHQLTLKVLVATIDAQWEGRGDVGSARYEPALLPPIPYHKGFKLQ